MLLPIQDNIFEFECNLHHFEYGYVHSVCSPTLHRTAHNVIGNYNRGLHITIFKVFPTARHWRIAQHYYMIHINNIKYGAMFVYQEEQNVAASGTRQPRNGYQTIILVTKVVELDMISPMGQKSNNQ